MAKSSLSPPSTAAITASRDKPRPSSSVSTASWITLTCAGNCPEALARSHVAGLPAAMSSCSPLGELGAGAAWSHAWALAFSALIRELGSISSIACRRPTASLGTAAGSSSVRPRKTALSAKKGYMPESSTCMMMPTDHMSTALPSYPCTSMTSISGAVTSGACTTLHVWVCHALHALHALHACMHMLMSPAGRAPPRA